MSDIEPSLSQLTGLLGKESQKRADRNLARFHQATGNKLDVGIREHQAALLRWLNSWLCRIAYPKEGDPDEFGRSLMAWHRAYGSSLPDRPLVKIDASDIAVIADAYEDLRCRPATPRRSIAPTAAAKILFALRPDTIPPWDRKIAYSTVGGVARKHFRDPLTRGSEWALRISEEAAAREISDILAHVARPASSLAKIWDEWNYLTITRGKSPG